MTAIAPISSISSIQPISAVDGIGKGPVAPTSSQVNRFESLMQLSRSAPPMLYGTSHPSTIGRLVSAEDKMLHGVMERVNTFAADAGTMDMRSLVAGQMQLMGDLTNAMTHLTIGTSVAQSGKSAIQNLFKNQ